MSTKIFPGGSPRHRYPIYTKSQTNGNFSLRGGSSGPPWIQGAHAGAPRQFITFILDCHP
jgi:hypothetical protein